MSTTDVEVINEKVILYKGVRFVADPDIANRISIFLVRDNHSTIKVYGTTPEAILTEVNRILKIFSDADSGVIFLMHDRKEIKRYSFTIDEEQAKKQNSCYRDKYLGDILKLEDVKVLLPKNIDPKN